MSRKIAPAFAAALALALGAACAHNTPPPSLRPALSGTWVLRGDSAQARRDTVTGVPAARTGYERGEGGEGGYGGRGGRRGGERGEGGYGGGRGSSYNPEAVAVALAAVHRGEGRITIVQTDTLVHFDFADASYFDMAPNGHSQDDVWRNVGRIKSMARWTDAGLLLRRKTEDGVTVSQTYARPAGANDMTVTTVISGPVPRPVTEKRVYVPAAAGK